MTLPIDEAVAVLGSREAALCGVIGSDSIKDLCGAIASVVSCGVRTAQKPAPVNASAGRASLQRHLFRCLNRTAVLLPKIGL